MKKLTKREKAILTVSAVTVTITSALAVYFGVKYFSDHGQVTKLADNTNTLMSAASEGLFDEALATVGRKIAYRKDREEYLFKRLLSHPGEKDLCNCLERVRSELNVLTERQSKFLAAQKLYGIDDIASA